MTTTQTTTKTAARLQPGDVVVSHYDQYAMDMTTLTMTKAASGTDYLVVQSMKRNGDKVTVHCKKRRADDRLGNSRLHHWHVTEVLEVIA